MSFINILSDFQSKLSIQYGNSDFVSQITLKKDDFYKVLFELDPNGEFIGTYENLGDIDNVKISTQIGDVTIVRGF